MKAVNFLILCSLIVTVFSCQYSSKKLIPYDASNFDVKAYYETDKDYLEFLEKGACQNIEVKKREVELIEMKFEDNMVFFEKLTKIYLGDCQLCRKKATAYYYLQLRLKTERINQLKIKADKIKDKNRIETLDLQPIIQTCKSYWELLDSATMRLNQRYDDKVTQTFLNCGSYCEEEKLMNCAGFEIREDLTLRELEKIFVDSSAYCNN